MNHLNHYLNIKKNTRVLKSVNVWFPFPLDTSLHFNDIANAHSILPNGKIESFEEVDLPGGDTIIMVTIAAKTSDDGIGTVEVELEQLRKINEQAEKQYPKNDSAQNGNTWKM